MKTIARLGKVEDAHLCRMRLEAVGIEAFVQDENMAQLEQPLSDRVGGVSVQVNDEDYDTAMEFLAADKGIAAEPEVPQ